MTDISDVFDDSAYDILDTGLGDASIPSMNTIWALLAIGAGLTCLAGVGLYYLIIALVCLIGAM